MTRRRVVVTGIGIVSPIGNTLETALGALRADRHGIRTRPDWDAIGQLGTRLAADCLDVDLERWPRKRTRSMGRVSLLAAAASDAAIADAAFPEASLTSERVGLAYGSTHGSSSELEQFCRTLFAGNSLKGLASSTYLKFMSHTCAANLAGFYGIRGRVITTCSACVSSSQAIGFGYEAIRAGTQDVMLCGGAEEMHFVHAGVFDILYAASTKYNDRPDRSPRPFDRDRDGLVVGEGAGTLVLESYEHARARGAPIHGEILGYGTNCDGTHVTNPSADGMAGAMRLALADAGLGPEAIGYVNAHATATLVGDIAESKATAAVLGTKTPISSTKGFTGHTLGACGAIELAFCLGMMREGFLAPSRNLEHVDPECAPLDYVVGAPREERVDVMMSNNFAFGGLNTSLIVRRLDEDPSTE